MKKLFVILAMLVAMNANAQWQQSIYFTNGRVNSLVKIGNNIFAGVYCNPFPIDSSGVYVSTNNGINWTRTSFNKETCEALAIQGNIIYAGAQRFGVSYSTNNGLNWVQTSLDSQYVTCLTAKDNKVFCGTYYHGVFYSSDYGSSWIQTPSLSWNPESLAIIENTVYVGAWGLFKSTNNGTNWIKTSLPDYLVTALAIPDSNNIYAGVSAGGIFYSSNSGATWVQNSTLGDVYSIIINNNIIYAGSHTGIYISKDNGQTWVQKNQGYNNYYVMDLLVKDNYIFAGSFGGYIFRRLISDIIGIQNISTETPSAYSLSQNYPNPFNPTTNIKFSIPALSFPRVPGGDLVQLKVYDVQGREVQTLVNEKLQPGTYEASFDGSALNSGVYFYKLITGTFSETKKMLLIK